MVYRSSSFNIFGISIFQSTIDILDKNSENAVFSEYGVKAVEMANGHNKHISV